VDKKLLLTKSLAEYLYFSLHDVEQLINRFPKAPGKKKADGSMVTELDLELSLMIEKIVVEQFPDHIFYSEEKFSEWGFPLIAVDPLDGTREYMAGRPEWALSVARFLKDEFIGEGWIYNPLTKELYCETSHVPHADKKIFYGEVSRSEWEKGLFNSVSSARFNIKPMGSIAYKLGRLSAHKLDFVVSLQPKNIWDIAAGTILAQAAGYQFYSQGKKVTKVEKYYRPPLIWCREEIYQELSGLFP
jgi:myo-inositol-1(or 4)-monophosphatase